MNSAPGSIKAHRAGPQNMQGTPAHSAGYSNAATMPGRYAFAPGSVAFGYHTNDSTSMSLVHPGSQHRVSDRSDVIARFDNLQNDVRQIEYNATKTGQDLSQQVGQQVRGLYGLNNQLQTYGGQIHNLNGQVQSHGSQLERVDVKFERFDDQFKRVDEQMESQFQDVNGQLDDVNGQFEDVNGQLQTVNGQFQNVNGQLQTVNGQLQTVNHQLQNFDGNLHNLDAVSQERMLQVLATIRNIQHTQDMSTAALSAVQQQITERTAVQMAQDARLAEVEHTLRQFSLNARSEPSPCTSAMSKPDPSVTHLESDVFTDNPDQTTDTSLHSRTSGHSLPKTPCRPGTGRRESIIAQVGTPSGQTPTPTTTGRARFPIQSMNSILDNLFIIVENWTKQYATLPISSLAQDNGISALLQLCSDTVGRHWSSREILESSQRFFLVTAMVNRLLCQKVFDINIINGFEHPIGKKYNAMFDRNVRFREDHPRDSPTRGMQIAELADLAIAVTGQPTFWDYIDSRVTSVHQEIFARLSVLVPVAQRYAGALALRRIVDNAFRIAVRMTREHYEFTCNWPVMGERYEEKTMVVRDPEFPGSGASSHTHMVKLCIAPNVIQKKHVNKLDHTHAYKAQVLLTLKRGAERNHYRNNHGHGRGGPRRGGR